MSTAWYKPNRLPQKIRSWTSSTATAKSASLIRTIEVWETTCVVTNMNTDNGDGGTNGSDSSDSDESQQRCRTPFSVLINPGNPSLSGVSKFAYFPVGGPEPSPDFQIGKDSHPIMGYVTTWGGMEVGNGMSFPSNTVDGIIHQYGGRDLQRECEKALSNTWTGGVGRLAEGKAISTPSVGPKLREASGYDLLVHTVPPFVDEDYRVEDGSSGGKKENRDAIGDHNNFLLTECYRNSLRTAATASPSSSLLKIACPLLGAGCRGFSVERAVKVAATATTQWMLEADTIDASAPAKPTTVDPVAEEERNMATNDNDRNTISAQSPFSVIAKWLKRGNDDSVQSEKDEVLDYPSHQAVTLAFGIPDGEIREQLIEAIDHEMKLQVP